MNILVIGDEQNFIALQRKGGLAAHTVERADSLKEAQELQNRDLIIDLQFDAHPENAGLYARYPDIPVLAGIVKTSLQTVKHTYGCSLIGCNWLPGFIDMPVTEISLLEEAQKPILAAIMLQLGWEYEQVQDAVGMVTPRVVCMIINEAYMAAETNTASREDIDVAMKLGTNYPMGPFEWSKKIGIREVYEVLTAVYTATGNERYAISELLKKEATNS
ncbi:3-hydroxyacyl-CoA dehydrogenase family protein [Chitinophaga sancti]|uniref:3-hydroxyacyl-CoA dehydrogenase family protein n=1 Tax=Chitinophaga sancti TaxID=1004 RepID=A0A1K1RI69_9BACT|nr:3-hydroxyacyl-CoA dehydrogenase family protein [Chitinophaga sancti]WQD60640.1 3-hydroxyacyl-CoA dehydrogenase family protein [Chitinophaga sancti]WQG87232.1 3-hydroxyacyl-CoA dehydrogenase family protein [Chitinophaga sancti]SFW71633.1 3-hydroxybutyryl-CoA dehydrogenase [Chitinophaga sancti]